MNRIFAFLLCTVFFGLSGLKPSYASRELTLDQVKELALENNRTLKVSGEHRQAARYLRKASFTQFLPSFDFAAQYLRTNKPFSLLSEDLFLPVIPYSAIDPNTNQLRPLQLLQADPPALVFGPEGMPLRDEQGDFVFQNYAWIPQSEVQMGQKNNFLMHFNLSQPIYTGGKIRAQYHMTGEIENMAKYKQQLSEAEVLLESEKLFWKLLTLQEKKELAKEYVTMLKALVYDMEGYEQEGIVNMNDVLRAKVAQQEAELESLKAENGLAQVSMALNRLTGLPFHQQIVAKEELQWQPQEYRLEELWEQGRTQRPELKMAATRAGLADAVSRLAKAGKYPDIALGAGYFAVNPNPYDGFSNDFGHDWMVGVTLLMPVYHWGERRHLHNAAQHEKRVQKYLLEDARELVQLDISRAYYQLLEARKTVEIRELALQQANENLKNARNHFDVGALSTTDLLDAQVLWHDAYTELVEAKSNLRQSIAELDKASGNR